MRAELKSESRSTVFSVHARSSSNTLTLADKSGLLSIGIISWDVVIRTEKADTLQPDLKLIMSVPTSLTTHSITFKNNQNLYFL